MTLTKTIVLKKRIVLRAENRDKMSDAIEVLERYLDQTTPKRRVMIDGSLVARVISTDLAYYDEGV